MIIGVVESPKSNEFYFAGPVARVAHSRSLAWIAILWFSAMHGFAASPTLKVHTQANAAPLTSSISLKRVSQITQYGITWTFASPVAAGQFITGDWYVVGPTTVVAVDPKPLFGGEVPASEISERERKSVRDGRFVRNGSTLNPPARQEVGYDSGVRNFFKPELATRIPVELKPGDCLASSISLKVGEKSAFPYHDSGGGRDHHDDSPTRSISILTCVERPLPEDAFRPSYGDRSGRIYYARNLRRELLPRLSPTRDMPDLAFWVRIFERPWVNTCIFGFEQPMENMPRYGQWVSQACSMAGLMLMVDLAPEKKEALLVRLVQVGIDYWGLIRNGHPGWRGFGGHSSGRKFPILFAGLLLGDPEMASPSKAYPHAEFGEDNQTMYGEGWTGAKALFSGHTGVQSASGQAERPNLGPYEHLPPSKWTKANFNSESYRRANTSSSWVGQALVMRLLHAEPLWQHDAYFDYVDRWMTEDDRLHRREIMKYFPDAPLSDAQKWSHQGNTWEPFVKSMWNRYRGPIRPSASADGNKASGR